jgi:hypothetical protein
MKIPDKQELIDDLLKIIDNVDTSDADCLSALKVLRKASPDLALRKAMTMRSEGKKTIPVTDLLLSLIPVEKKESMPMIDVKDLDELE